MGDEIDQSIQDLSRIVSNKSNHSMILRQGGPDEHQGDPME